MRISALNPDLPDSPIPNPIPGKDPMVGVTIVKVVESQSEDFVVGDTYMKLGTWQDFEVHDPKIPTGFPLLKIPKGKTTQLMLLMIKVLPHTCLVQSERISRQ